MSSIWSQKTFASSSQQSNSELSSFRQSSPFKEYQQPEKVEANVVNEMFKNCTQSIADTLKLSKIAENHFNKVNLELAEKVSAELSKIEAAKELISSRLLSIQEGSSAKINPKFYEALLNRYTIVEGKLLLRQASLRALLKSANDYLHQSNIGEMVDTMEETHNRFLILQKDINGNSNELEDKLDNIATLLEKFCTLSFYGISSSASTETPESSLQKIEREETFGDALRQIRNISDLIKKAKEESDCEITNSESYSSTSLESVSDIL